MQKYTWGFKYKNVYVFFVKRYANKVADFLGRSTYCLYDRILRVSNNHLGIIDVLMNGLID